MYKTLKGGERNFLFSCYISDHFAEIVLEGKAAYQIRIISNQQIHFL